MLVERAACTTNYGRGWRVEPEVRGFDDGRSKPEHKAIGKPGEGRFGRIQSTLKMCPGEPNGAPPCLNRLLPVLLAELDGRPGRG